MNLIPMIREQLGLDENEEFNLINPNGVPFTERFRFTDRTFQIEENERWIEAESLMLKLLLKGECEVVKLPFKPKEGELYYYVNLNIGEVMGNYYYSDMNHHVLIVNSGNCYRTKEEAEKHVDEWMSKVYVKDWKELLK